MAVYSTSIAFGSLSIISAVLLLLTAPQHIKTRNTGTLLMIFWGTLGNLSQGISALLLNDNDAAVTPSLVRWCDFSGAMYYMYPFGFSAGTLALLRKLESIASTRQISQSSRDKKRTLAIDLFFGIVCPLLLVPMRIVVQGHRTDIIQGITCVAPLFASVPAVFLAVLPPFLMSTANLVYACLVLRWFVLRRNQFAALLGGTGLNKRRYVRLMTLALIEIAIGWPIALFIVVYFFAHNLQDGFKPYTSWSDVHEGFDDVLPWVVQETSLERINVAALEVSRWVGILLAAVFFVFFGLSKQAWVDHGDSVRRVFSSTRSTAPLTKSSFSNADSGIHSSGIQTHDHYAFEHDIEGKGSPTTPSSDWISMKDSQYAVPSSFSGIGHVIVSSERIVQS